MKNRPSSRPAHDASRGHQIRITSGLYRGHALASPQSAATHPMGDRVRLALFNSLSAWWQNEDRQTLCVLDAYAGTGALGLEALSRGATHVDFIEKDRRALTALRQNLQALGLSATSVAIYPQSVVKFTSLTPAAAARQGYDLILIDPPYDHFNPTEFAHLAQLLAPGGRLVLSHPDAFSPEAFAAATQPADSARPLRLLSTRHYAAAHLSFYAVG